MNIKGNGGKINFIIFSKVLVEIVKIHIKQVNKFAYKHFI
jgi:hypothetical protein